jgi:hypothetical protein
MLRLLNSVRWKNIYASGILAQVLHILAVSAV